jgi:hypothetical protein
MGYNMETVDTNRGPSAPESNVVVSFVLKAEIGIAVLFLSDKPDVAVTLGGVCALLNQITENACLKKETSFQKAVVLLWSLLGVMFFYCVAFLIRVDFTSHYHGDTKIDISKIWLLAKLLFYVFVFLVAVRSLAVGGDKLVNRMERNKTPKTLIRK